MLKQHLGIYIHSPFCDVKCAYCDFYSLEKEVISNEECELYFQHLQKDLDTKLDYILPEYQVGTIFFGGGTPSKMSSTFLEKILHLIYNKLPVAKHHVEISIEVNPESLTLQKAKDYYQMGINRISVGIQSTQDKVLEYLGRLNNKNAYKRVFSHLKKAGFSNISADLIYGIPSQTLEGIQKDIDWLLREDVKHISAYSLTIEPNTKLYQEINNKNKDNIKSNVQYWHHQYITSYLKKQGFKRYEVSNFFKEKKYICKHNLSYWKYRPYLGIGVSSHSLLKNRRLMAPRSLAQYQSQDYFKVQKEEIISGLLINIFRLLSYQGYLFIQSMLGSEVFSRFLYILNIFSQKHWVLMYKNGFQISNQGILQSDTMIEQSYNFLNTSL